MAEPIYPNKVPKGMESVLETRNLRVEYQSRDVGQEVKLALNSLDLRVGSGKAFGFLGPNGDVPTGVVHELGWQPRRILKRPRSAHG